MKNWLDERWEHITETVGKEEKPQQSEAFTKAIDASTAPAGRETSTRFGRGADYRARESRGQRRRTNGAR